MNKAFFSYQRRIACCVSFITSCICVYIAILVVLVVKSRKKITRQYLCHEFEYKPYENSYIRYDTIYVQMFGLQNIRTIFFL